MSKYKGLFTFDEDNHRYIPIAQNDGVIDTMDYEPDSKPTEPLIVDEKFRKIVRLWADMNGYTELLYDKTKDCLYSPYGSDDTDTSVSISFDNVFVFDNLKHRKLYTITELCGKEEE